VSDEHNQDQQADGHPHYTHLGELQGHYRTAKDGSPMWLPPVVTMSDAEIAEVIENHRKRPPMVRPMPCAPENPPNPLCKGCGGGNWGDPMHWMLVLGFALGLGAGALLFLYWPY